MACQVTSTARSGRYQIVTDYITDPDRASVVMRTRLDPLTGDGRDLQLYVRYDATVNGNGGGGPSNAGADDATVDIGTTALVSSDKNTATSADQRDYGTPLSGALRGGCAFAATSSGYAGTESDGLTQLDRDHQLTQTYPEALQGNVVQTARVIAVPRQPVVLALGYGPSPEEAVKVAGESLGAPFQQLYDKYTAQWREYDAALAPVPAADPVTYRRSVNILKASEDKTFPGAVVSSLASPWGQAVSAAEATDGKPVYFGSYRQISARDMYHAFTGLLFAGDKTTATDMVRWLFERQQKPDGAMPRRSLLNGKPVFDSAREQLDETAYPILMALQAGLDRDEQLYTGHIARAADFLVARGPASGADRWQEQDGYEPSTIAAQIAGLVSAAVIAQRNSDPVRSRLYLATADHFQRNVKNWTVTNTGPHGRHFIRLSKTGAPDAPITYNLGHGSIEVDQRYVVAPGFLELTRLGALSPRDPDVIRSLEVIDQTIKRDTPTGPGWYRYGTVTAGSEDGYGECHEPDPTMCPADGAPLPNGNVGSGHLWPVLAGERGEHALQVGDKDTASTLLTVLTAQTSGAGLVPEQVWENPAVPASPFGTDPAVASIGLQPGQPTGSAAPLTWAQAQYVRLAMSMAGDRPVEQPAEVRARYVERCQCPPAGPLPITLDAPAAPNRLARAVTGKTIAGMQVDIAQTSGTTTTVVSTTAGPDGTFTAELPDPEGPSVVTAVATQGEQTGYAQLATDPAQAPAPLITSSASADVPTTAPPEQTPAATTEAPSTEATTRPVTGPVTGPSLTPTSTSSSVPATATRTPSSSSSPTPSYMMEARNW
jgi:glucoamylase